MGGPRAYYAKWTKSDRERQILNDFTYLWNIKKLQTKNLIKQNRHRPIYTESKLMAATGVGWGGRWKTLFNWSFSRTNYCEEDNFIINILLVIEDTVTESLNKHFELCTKSRRAFWFLKQYSQVIGNVRGNFKMSWYTFAFKINKGLHTSNLCAGLNIFGKIAPWDSSALDILKFKLQKNLLGIYLNGVIVYNNLLIAPLTIASAEMSFSMLKKLLEIICNLLFV